MTFISYSQCHEDYILYRALQDVKKGFYVDVGASFPESDSVTKAFYDRGWHGINIESNPTVYKILQNERLNDLNICCLISDDNSKSNAFYIVNDGNGGLSTADQTQLSYLVESNYDVTRISVPSQTLNSVFAKSLPENTEIHFLKIDVEGLEKKVLQGLDLNLYRPWIIVIECMLANRQIECHGVWETILIKHRYQCVFQDGLNRYYLANEKAELSQHFKYPISVFDNVKSITEIQSMNTAAEQTERADIAERQLTELNVDHGDLQRIAAEQTERADKAERQLTELEIHHTAILESNHHNFIQSQELSQKLLAIEASISWQFTAPFRWLLKLLGAFPKKFKKYCVMIFLRFAVSVFQFPRCVKIIKRVLRYFPNLERKIRLILSHSGTNIQPTSQPESASTILQETLSPYALDILKKLNREIN